MASTSSSLSCAPNWRTHDRHRLAQLPHRLRRIEVVRDDTGDILVFLTHHHGLGASTVAAICKDRWQVELPIRKTVALQKPGLDLRMFTVLTALYGLECVPRQPGVDDRRRCAPIPNRGLRCRSLQVRG
jgi:hypothetical protein